MFYKLCTIIFLITFVFGVYYLRNIYGVLYTLTKNIKIISEKYFRGDGNNKI